MGHRLTHKVVFENNHGRGGDFFKIVLHLLLQTVLNLPSSSSISQNQDSFPPRTGECKLCQAFISMSVVCQTSSQVEWSAYLSTHREIAGSTPDTSILENFLSGLVFLWSPLRMVGTIRNLFH